LFLGIDGFESAPRLWLLLIIPVLIAAYLIVLRRKTHQGMRYTNTTIMGAVMGSQSQWLRHVTVALGLLSLIALTFAWAQPLGVEKVPRERATVVVVIDISLSMTATDVSPTRLDAAKAEAKDFIADLPDGYNVSIVSLSGNPAVRLPPMDDRAAAERAIDVLEPQESSAIGTAITTALAALDQAPLGEDETPAPGMIVFLSDGENTNPQSPLQAAQQAAEREVPIYTIAFGTDNGYVDLDGTRAPVPPDQDLLRQISEITGGEMYPADNAGQLKEAYTSIQSEVGYEEENKEVTATVAGIGLIFALVAAVGAVMLGARFR
jgi:Ca-activated chloride channel family protein